MKLMIAAFGVLGLLVLTAGGLVDTGAARKWARKFGG